MTERMRCDDEMSFRKCLTSEEMVSPRRLRSQEKQIMKTKQCPKEGADRAFNWEAHYKDIINLNSSLLTAQLDPEETVPIERPQAETESVPVKNEIQQKKETVTDSTILAAQPHSSGTAAKRSRRASKERSSVRECTEDDKTPSNSTTAAQQREHRRQDLVETKPSSAQRSKRSKHEDNKVSSTSKTVPERQKTSTRAKTKAVMSDPAKTKPSSDKSSKIGHDGDEEPSSSKSALRKSERTRSSTATAVKGGHRNASGSSHASSTQLNYKKIIASIEEGEASSAKQLESVDIDDQNDLLPMPTEYELNPSNTDSIPFKLMRLLSNLYLNTAKKLCVEYSQRCVDDLEYCSKMHYHSAAPPPLQHGTETYLVTALKLERYQAVAIIVDTACHLGNFPAPMGLNIFSLLTELMLSVYATRTESRVCQLVYHRIEDAFDHAVRRFPPCWLVMRPKYVQFLQQPIDPVRLMGRRARTRDSETSKKPFETMLKLLEVTMEKYTPAELGIRGVVGQKLMPSPSKPRRRQVESANDAPDDLNGSILAQDLKRAAVPLPVTPRRTVRQHQSHQSRTLRRARSPSAATGAARRRTVLNLSALDRTNPLEHAFEGLPPRARLERLMAVLRQIVQMLEHDMVMWLMHHHKRTRPWIFCEDNAPLTVMLFEFTDGGTRLTEIVRRLFTLFGKATSKGIPRHYLQIIERFIALAVCTSNTADMDNTPDGLRYPYVGAVTKKMIHEFYKTFKAYNITSMDAFLNTINMLTVPFVRYEFIDHFLQIFNLSPIYDMSPKKIYDELKRKHWISHKTAKSMTADDAQEDLSREKYLALLLIALRDYCEWNGTIQCLHQIVNNEPLNSFQTRRSSVHHDPTHGSGEPLNLDAMEKQVMRLQRKMTLDTSMERPQTDLTIINVCVDGRALLKYRIDSKYMLLTYDQVRKRARVYNDIDFSDWLELLKPLSKSGSKHSHSHHGHRQH